MATIITEQTFVLPNGDKYVFFVPDHGKLELKIFLKDHYGIINIDNFIINESVMGNHASIRLLVEEIVIVGKLSRVPPIKNLFIISRLFPNSKAAKDAVKFFTSYNSIPLIDCPGVIILNNIYNPNARTHKLALKELDKYIKNGEDYWFVNSDKIRLIRIFIKNNGALKVNIAEITKKYFHDDEQLWRSGYGAALIDIECSMIIEHLKSKNIKAIEAFSNFTCWDEYGEYHYEDLKSIIELFGYIVVNRKENITSVPEPIYIPALESTLVKKNTVCKCSIL